MTWLARYREHEAKATPGLWLADTRDADDVVIWASRDQDDDRFLCNVGGSNPSQVGVVYDVDAGNAKLIELLRNSAPALAALVEACRGHGDAPGHCEICAALTALDRDAGGTE